MIEMNLEALTYKMFVASIYRVFSKYLYLMRFMVIAPGLQINYHPQFHYGYFFVLSMQS